jgi:hypothetical protein
LSAIEVTHEIEAARLRRIDQMNAAIFHAWQIENIKALTKKTERKVGKKTQIKITLPKLEKLLIPDQEKKHQTVGEMRGALAVLSARTGFPLKKAPPRGD